MGKKFIGIVFLLLMIGVAIPKLRVRVPNSCHRMLAFVNIILELSGHTGNCGYRKAGCLKLVNPQPFGAS